MTGGFSSLGLFREAQELEGTLPWERPVASTSASTLLPQDALFPGKMLEAAGPESVHQTYSQERYPNVENAWYLPTTDVPAGPVNEYAYREDPAPISPASATVPLADPLMMPTTPIPPVGPFPDNVTMDLSRPGFVGFTHWYPIDAGSYTPIQLATALLDHAAQTWTTPHWSKPDPHRASSLLAEAVIPDPPEPTTQPTATMRSAIEIITKWRDVVTACLANRDFLAQSDSAASIAPLDSPVSIPIYVTCPTRRNSEASSDGQASGFELGG
jgi:hypothetical protein